MLVLSDKYGGVAKEIIFYVGIIEDDFALRRTLEAYFALRDDFKIVFSGGRLADIFQTRRAHKLDYLILDEHLEDGSGSKMIGKLRKHHPDVKIIFISGDQNAQLMLSVLRSGAASFICKPFSLQDLANSFEGIIENGSFLTPNAITRLLKIIDESEPPKIAGIQPKLTDREKMVANHIVDGKTYKEIAEMLSVSVHAINYHTKNIYTKLNIKSRHQLSKKLNRL